MFLRIRSLVVKELLALVRDPRGRFILVVPPLVQMLVFTFAATQEVKDVPVAVLNKDYGTHARDLVARVEGSPNFSRVVHLRSDAEVAPAIRWLAPLLVLRAAHYLAADALTGGGRQALRAGVQAFVAVVNLARHLDT